MKLFTSSTDAFISVVAAVSLVAIATDLWKGRIFNALTFPVMILGLVLAFFFPGSLAAHSGVDSVMGVILGFILFGWMFWLGMMGAGDIKLLMAFGALGGAKFATETAILSILLGGVFSGISLLAQGEGRKFIQKGYRFVLSTLTPGLKSEGFAINRSLTIPFASSPFGRCILDCSGPPSREMGDLTLELKRNSERGQAVIEYIALLAVVLIAFTTVVRPLFNRLRLNQFLLTPLTNTYANAYQNGHPEGTAIDSQSGPQHHPRYSSAGGENFRIFINPGARQ